MFDPKHLRYGSCDESHGMRVRVDEYCRGGIKSALLSQLNVIYVATGK